MGEDWDRCAYCGLSLGMPVEGRPDEADPATAPALHPECLGPYMERRMSEKSSGKVFMFRAGDIGPLSD